MRKPSVSLARVNRIDHWLLELAGIPVCAGRSASSGSANRPHFATASASAEELVGAIGLEPGHAHSMRHLEALEDLSRFRIDSPQVALAIFPGAVPEFSVNPRDAGNEAVGFDGAKNRPCFGIDLMDLPASVLPHPECPFGPRESRVIAPPGAGMVASTRPVFGSIFWMQSSAI